MGIIDLREALQIARERGLDLIQVTEKVEPPVCKIMEAGKYLYRQEKKERELWAKQTKAGGMKEIRLTFNISEHDMETKVIQTEKFLKKGDKVRIEMRLRGRENALKNFAKEKINKFWEKLEERIPFKVERGLKEMPKRLSIIITKQ